MADANFTAQDYLNQMNADIAARTASPSMTPSTSSAPTSTPSTPLPSSSSGGLPGVSDKDAANAYIAQMNADITARTAQVSNPNVSNSNFLGTSAVRGLMSLPDTVAATGNVLASNAQATGGTMVDPVSGMTVQLPKDANYSSPSQLPSTAVASTMGLNPNAQPSGEGMRMLGSGIQAAGAVAGNPLTYLFPGSTIPWQIGAGFTGGTTGETGRAIAQAAGAPQWAQTAADIGGNLVGGYPANAAGLKFANDISPAAQLYKDAGVRPSPDIVAAGSPSTSMVAGRGLPVTLNPFTPGATRAANAKTLSTWKTAADNLAGPQNNPSTIGDMVQSQAQAWQQGQETALGNAYQAIKGQMDPNVKVNAIATFAATKASTPATGAALPSVLGDVSNALKAGGGQLSYQDLDYWKQTVGKYIGSDAYDNLVGNDKAAVQKLYSGLQTDTRSAAETNLPGSAAQLTALDNQYSDFMNFSPQTMQKITKNNVTGGQVWNRLTTGADPDASQLGALVNKGVINNTAQQAIAGQVLREMGTDNAGNWNATKFFSNYQQLSPQAKTNIFGYDPATMTQYDRLGQIAGQLGTAKMEPGWLSKAGMRFLKPILGAVGLEGIAEAEGMNGIAHTALAHPVIAGTAAIGGGTSFALARLMAKPSVVNYLSKPVTTQDKFIAGLQSLARMQPAIAGDVQTVASALPQSN